MREHSCHSGPIPWGRVSILAPIVTTYGPACYQVQMFPNFSGGTAPFACNWDLGDGTTSSDCSADHLYASTGPFTVNGQRQGCQRTSLLSNADRHTADCQYPADG